MPSALRLVLIVAAPFAMAACGSGENKGKDQRTAAGEILPGSISDAMLPYDTVRSQPPLAPKTAPSDKAPAAGKQAGEEPEVTRDPAAAPVEAPVAPIPATE